MNRLDSEIGPSARFIEDSVSILRLRVNLAGLIVAANRQAEILIGAPLVGRAWDVLLPNVAEPSPFSTWLADPSRPRLLNVRTHAGSPQTLRVSVEEDAEGYVLLGESDSAEQSRLASDVLQLNRELNELNRVLTQKNAELAEMLRERVSILRETHHRVKNNLALITSLMRLTAGRSRNEETKAALLEMQSRIHSVIVLNQTLYRTASYTSVRLADYLTQIATYVFEAQAPKSGEVRLVLEFEPVEVATAQAIPCGLIANELMTNSLKHAFPEGRGGEIRVGLANGPDGLTRLRVSDTGAGLPQGFETRSPDSLGLQLVGDLSRQLSGCLDIGPGSMFTVSFRPRVDLGATGEFQVVHERYGPLS